MLNGIGVEDGECCIFAISGPDGLVCALACSGFLMGQGLGGSADPQPAGLIGTLRFCQLDAGKAELT